MIEITSTELRRNLGKYLEIAFKKEESVLVRYRNKSVFALTPKPLHESESEKNDKYFDQPEVIESIRRGREDVKHGRTRKFTSIKDLWEGIA
jgi:PHD/YefM family antitoxin component YafN of YafNO toxin-antitoxin module